MTKKLLIYSLLSTLISLAGFRCAEDKLIFSEDFSTPLDEKKWVVEMEKFPNSTVYTRDNKLIVDTKGGVTVWLNKPLSGNLRIEFDRTILLDSGKNDRLSDMNNFWMASDPQSANAFSRSGKFEDYDSMQLYYTGVGGNTNKTTRFRKYFGNGQKPLITDLSDKQYLLSANKEYHIQIIVNNGRSTFSVDGETFFDYQDEKPLTQGYFGFRSTWSRQAIRNLKIFQLP